MKNFAVDGVKKNVPAEDHHKWLLCFDKAAGQAKADLEIKNTLGSYTFLLDSEGRVRWSASGMIHEDEGDGEVLGRCVDKLLGECFEIANENTAAQTKPKRAGKRKTPTKR